MAGLAVTARFDRGPTAPGGRWVTVNQTDKFGVNKYELNMNSCGCVF